MDFLFELARVYWLWDSGSIVAIWGLGVVFGFILVACEKIGSFFWAPCRALVKWCVRFLASCNERYSLMDVGYECSNVVDLFSCCCYSLCIDGCVLAVCGSFVSMIHWQSPK